MYLVEKHIIKNSHPFYNECDDLAFRSKNLYNRALYNIRQYYFENKKYLKFIDQFNEIKHSDCYQNLPRKVSNQVLKLVDQNFKSFFNLMKTEGQFARIPKYLDKSDGRYVVKYEKGAISKKEFKKYNKIKLSQTNISIKTNVNDWEDIKEVRVVPRANHYVIEVVYEQIERENNNINIAAIDPGLNNLATVVYNNGKRPYIINGKPLKSINQHYNKEKARLQGRLENNKYTSDRIQNLTLKRNNKINDHMHKASRMLVNHLVSNQVGTLIIGKNTGQKQDSNMGKKGNQNFVDVPIFKFLDMVAYKARLEGIEVKFNEESYTSKCSFFDNEFPEKREHYMGKRVKRGLFRTNDGKLINADVNGGYNIMKKVVPDSVGDRGCAVHPIRQVAV